MGTDSQLIMACAVAADIWRRHDRLFRNPSEFEDEAARAKVAAMLWATVDPVLEQICALPPTTRTGTTARAAVFLMWDAGETLARADTGRVMDRLLLAMLLDLLQTPANPHPDSPTGGRRDEQHKKEPLVTDNIFADLIKIGEGDLEVLAAKLQEFSEFSDDVHSAVLKKCNTIRRTGH